MILFGCPAVSEDAPIPGRLHMRYCNVSFAEKKPLGVCSKNRKVAELLRGNASGDGSADCGSDGS